MAREIRAHLALLAVQTALALILLTGAALLIRSFVNVYHVDPGFSTENMQTARINLPARRYQSESELTGFFGKILERLSVVPGVSATAGVTNLPLSGEGSAGYISLDDRPAPPPGQTLGASRQIVSPGYFRAMRIPLIEGWTFTEADRAGAPHVVIIDRTMARRFWPEQSPIGRRIKRGTLPAPFPWMTVIGVVSDVKHFSLTGNPGPTVFLPYLQARRLGGADPTATERTFRHRAFRCAVVPRVGGGSRTGWTGRKLPPGETGDVARSHCGPA